VQLEATIRGGNVEIEDSLALVTGGASGIGRAVATALAERGASVAIVDVDAQGGAEVAGQLDAELIVADVSDLHQCLHAVERATERFGGLDLVHLNAGVSTGCGIAEDFDLAAYRRAIGVNLDGVVFGVHAALPALRQRGGGAIVATASLAGLTGMPFDPVYTANKHAVVGLVRALGPALTPEGIRVNAVCPGFAESKIIEPIRESLLAEGLPIIPAEQVAEAVLNLFEGEMSGECWYVQAGRPSEPFRFRGIPGPRPTAA
jgi:NAD(P)-dependent dehydrogenase (short-subunit alcohol dehydrogenase family)